MPFLQGPQGRRVGRSHAAPSDARRARLLRAARHLCADESAGARRRITARRSGRACATASPTSSAPTMRRIRARRKPSPIPNTPVGHDRRADPRADHARSRECRPPDARTLRRSDQRRARSGSSASRERAASRSATTPTSPLSTSSAARRSATTGSPRNAAGRPMTASLSPAGRSAPSCAATSSCGTARSRPRRAAKWCGSRRRLGRVRGEGEVGSGE